MSLETTNSASNAPASGASPQSILMRVFLLKALGLVLLFAAAAASYCFKLWGVGAVYSFAWASLWALVIGAIGFSSFLKCMRVDSSRLFATMGIGMLFRLVILVVSQVPVYQLISTDWGNRSLLSTVGLYLVVMAVEVHVFNDALKTNAKTLAAKEGDSTQA